MWVIGYHINLSHKPFLAVYFPHRNSHKLVRIAFWFLKYKFKYKLKSLCQLLSVIDFKTKLLFFYVNARHRLMAISTHTYHHLPLEFSSYAICELMHYGCRCVALYVLKFNAHIRGVQVKKNFEPCRRVVPGRPLAVRADSCPHRWRRSDSRLSPARCSPCVWFGSVDSTLFVPSPEIRNIICSIVYH